MSCKHEQKDLLGRADGILCRACGKVFASIAEVEKDRKADKPAPKPKAPAKKKTTTEGKADA